eukprot:2130344-Amphidinium_carterae.1
MTEKEADIPGAWTNLPELHLVNGQDAIANLCQVHEAPQEVVGGIIGIDVAEEEVQATIPAKSTFHTNQKLKPNTRPYSPNLNHYVLQLLYFHNCIQKFNLSFKSGCQTYDYGAFVNSTAAPTAPLCWRNLR